MLNSAVAQPLQDRFLRGLRLVKQRLIHVTTFFSFSCKSRSAAKVGLVSKYHEKFSLLPIERVLKYPRRDLEVERVVRNAVGTIALRRSQSIYALGLPNTALGADRSYRRDAGCDKAQ